VKKNEPQTKKEKIRARNKKLHNILEAERIHEEQRQEIKKRQDPNIPKVLMGGFSKPIDEEVRMDWRGRAHALRERVLQAKKKAKGRWKGR
jgi:hypothetical protein